MYQNVKMRRSYISQIFRVNKPTWNFLKNRNHEVLFFTDEIDILLVRALDLSHPEWTFTRIDQIGPEDDLLDINKSTKSSNNPDKIDWEPLIDYFREITGDRVEKVFIEHLPSREIPGILRVTGSGALQDDLERLVGRESSHKWNLVINSNCALIQSIVELGPNIRSNEISATLMAQVWDNIRLQAGLLKDNALSDVVYRQQKFMLLVVTQLLQQNS